MYIYVHLNRDFIYWSHFMLARVLAISKNVSFERTNDKQIPTKTPNNKIYE